MPADYLFKNVGADDELWNVPAARYLLQLSPTGVPGTFSWTYSSLKPLTRTQVEAAATADIQTLRNSLKSQGPGQGADAVGAKPPTFPAFKDHSPFHLEQSADDIRSGFYRDMYALQGYRNAWYISSLFVLFLSQLWAETDKILPSIIATADATH